VNGVIAIGGILGILLAAGLALGLSDRRNFRLRWLFAAAALVLLNDALLTRGYGLLPRLLPGVERNWQGQALALLATMALASLPVFGWKRIGLTLRQHAGSLAAALPVALVYCGLFVALAMVLPDEASSVEERAFQWTMPGLQEEPFYRGLLLFALDRAFAGRIRFLGVEWGWGALLSCTLFGLAHAFGYSDGSFTVEPMIMALTALPALVAVWLRYRTDSLLLPILVHNFGNAIPLYL
jgi:uncharacterized protein